MIEGIKIDLPVEELRDHIRSRQTFHQAKAAWYQDRMADLEAGSTANPGMSNDPISGLRRSFEEHSSKVALFSVLADHLIPGETYRLSQSDLGTLEFISRYF